MDDPRLYRLVKLLSVQDWDYEFNDNYMIRQRGEENMLLIEEEINSLRQEGRWDDAEDVWNDWCPWASKSRT